MNKYFKYFLCALIVPLGVMSCSGPKASDKALEEGFVTPPSSIQTAVYWYWISDHISKEGVINDLHAMKQAGINRAFIGNIGLEDAPLAGGKVKFGTDEWWDVLHTALKTATELDIEIGLFNSPGWSQSGGPWVKPNQAMRYLASTRTTVTGGQKIDIMLPKPDGDFEDVKVIAYPAVDTQGRIMSRQNVQLTAAPASASATSLIDGNPQTEATLTGDKEGKVTLDFKTNHNFTLRSVKIVPADQPINIGAELQVKEGAGFTTLKKFRIDRHNGAVNVGFDPYAPVAISVPATVANEFRLVLSQVSSAVKLKAVELSTIPIVEKYAEKSLAKMFQDPLPYWHEYMWPAQPAVDDPSLLVKPATVQDISAHLSGDQLVWEAPAGDWVILRTGMVPTGTFNAPAAPDATGLEVDKMSREHTQAHFEAYMGEVIRRIPAEDRKTWKVVVQDSYETGGQNFTDDFLNQFQQRYGYNALPFLPVLGGVVIESEDASDRFLWDLRRMVADKVAYDYVGGLRDIAHKYGLRTWLENYGHWGFPGEFLQYGGQSDELGGEFWAEGELGDIENRAASSSAHIYGKTKVWAESFTSSGNFYGRYPAVIKQRGDRFFSEGINSSLLHVYVHQPYEDKKPGIVPWFGVEFNRFNTWFPQMDLFTTYLKRVNYMLQQGLNVADVAYFIGEDAPKMTGVADPALPEGYQFDYINAEVIERDMTVKDGLLTLPHGTQYRILVLPKQETMRPELLKKIKQLIEAGGVVMGPKPERSPSYQNYPQADQELQTLANSMWGSMEGVVTKSVTIGKGTLMYGMDMQAALDQVGCVPDMKLHDKVPVLYGHRTTPGAEIYFVTNQSDQPISFAAEFRVEGLQPELWDPVSGSRRKLPAFTPTTTGVTVPLELAPNQSAFVVFRDKAPKPQSGATNYPAPAVVKNLDGPWTVAFNKEQRGIETPLEMAVLANLADHEMDDVKHYSGTITYTTDFTLDAVPAGNLLVDLNDVAVMAKVKVNGQYAGGAWTPPYKVDITPYVKQGENQLEVEVVNLWVNRIVGDMKMPEKDRKIWMTINQWTAETPLPKSGLVGPVVIESVNYGE